jgi:hypothetical protein
MFFFFLYKQTEQVMLENVGITAGGPTIFAGGPSWFLSLFPDKCRSS